jgi:hypothetical protein
VVFEAVVPETLPTTSQVVLAAASSSSSSRGAAEEQRSSGLAATAEQQSSGSSIATQYSMHARLRQIIAIIDLQQHSVNNFIVAFQTTP